MRKPTPLGHRLAATFFRSGRVGAVRIDDAALRREVNDRIYVVGVSLASDDCIGRLDFLCECGVSGCELSAQMTLSEYADIRRQDGAIPSRYIVARDHTLGGGFFVVERHTEFAVVECPSGRSDTSFVDGCDGRTATSVSR